MDIDKNNGDMFITGYTNDFKTSVYNSISDQYFSSLLDSYCNVLWAYTLSTYLSNSQSKG
jgi:hypothetical protein